MPLLPPIGLIVEWPSAWPSDWAFEPVAPGVGDPDSLGLHRQDWFELYQAYQAKPRFDGITQIVSFRGLSGTRALLDGVYIVKGRRPASAVSSSDLPEELWRGARFFYELKRDPRFDDLQNRVVIEWGAATRAWHQQLNGKSDKSVVEILPAGRSLEPFADYLEFSLPYDQLKALFAREDAHPDWKAPLSAVAGVYLILAETAGHQYVGSASGGEGIWGRWRTYAAKPDGGNVKLRAVIERDPVHYPVRFRFSVLQTLPTTMTPREVLERETTYKQKLGTRATGLNSN